MVKIARNYHCKSASAKSSGKVSEKLPLKISRNKNPVVKIERLPLAPS